MTDKVFLTESRRAVLNGAYDGPDSTKRTHRSNIKKKTNTALDEIIAVADSGEFNNADVFDADQVYALLVALAVDRDTFETGDSDSAHVKHVDEDFRREILEAVDQFRLIYHDLDAPNGR